MDDMKKLVEKYKRELMEYSRAAAVPEKLSFPEMLPEEQEQPPAPTETAAQPGNPAEAPEESRAGDVPEKEERRPRIVGYSEDKSAMESIEKIFSEMGIPTQDDREQAPERPAFNELPPQLSGDVPQVDETNSNVPNENNNITGEREPEQSPQFPKQGEHTESEPSGSAALGVIPESGSGQGEQLGRRSFENQQSPVNSRDDIKPLVQQENSGYPAPPEQVFRSLDEFMRANPRQGSVQFRTYTARNALPVAGAKIVVTKVIGGETHTFYTLTTDVSGQTEEVILPAPPVALSQKPDSGIQPYALYDADITAEGYRPVGVRSLPVFEGILSVQRAAMIPAVNGGETETITDTEPDLTEVPDA